MSWVISDNYPQNSEWGNSIPVFSMPVPLNFLVTRNNTQYPRFSHWNNLISVPTEPNPNGFFVVNNDYPYLKFWNDNSILLGAFANSKLSRVTIPESVEYIGEFAFRNTSLKEVTISSDCTYSSTSFPDECKINFY